jgi:peptidoglycan hydrolase-like protein with peptidoglycan-binding domain
VKNDREAPLSAPLPGSRTDTQILPPPAADRPAGEEARLLGEPAEPVRRRRRTRIAAVGAIVLVGVAVALAVLLRSTGKPRADTGSGVPAGDTTIAVQRRTLTESAQVAGTLGYGSTLELYDRIPGTFTWLPGVGSVIRRGGTLFKIDQLPIVLMYGSVPAYRTLKAGVSDGQDVAQLNENLVALGYDPYGAIADYERFGEATAAAVRRWQQAEGLPQTGEVELGRVVFAASARRVTAVKATLGQDPPGGQETPQGKEPAEHAPAKEPAEQAPAKGTPAKGAPSKGAPAKGSPSGGASGPSGDESSGAGAGTPALTTTSTQQLVQVQLEADKQQLAHVGHSAPVTLPSGRTVGAHIASVGSVATESSSGGGESGKASIAVTLALDHRVPRLDAAPVTVELVEQRRRDVLSIPATALIATAGGGYAVETLQGGRRVEAPVTPGMFADGYVQIEGAGVHEGLTVTEPAE